MTLSITKLKKALSIITLSTMTLIIMILTIRTYSITAHGMMTLSVTILCSGGLDTSL